MACSFLHIHWFDVNHTSASTRFHLLYHSPCSELRLNHLWENIRLSHFVCNRPNRHHSTSVPRAEVDHTLLSRILKEKHHSQSAQGENSNHLFVAKRKLALASPVGIAYVFVCLDVYEELQANHLDGFSSVKMVQDVTTWGSADFHLVWGSFIHFWHVVKTGSACFSAQSLHFWTHPFVPLECAKIPQQSHWFQTPGGFEASWARSFRSTDWWYLRDWYQLSILSKFMPSHAKLLSG